VDWTHLPQGRVIFWAFLNGSIELEFFDQPSLVEGRSCVMEQSGSDRNRIYVGLSRIILKWILLIYELHRID